MLIDDFSVMRGIPFYERWESESPWAREDTSVRQNPEWQMRVACPGQE